jgi:uroporphyrinogen-III decarboxylase
MKNLPTTFHLKRGDTLLAILENCEPEEMFWLGCEFTPTEAFEEVKPFFETAKAAFEVNDWNAFDAAYREMRALGVELMGVDEAVEVRRFTLWIQDNHASLRFSEKK